MFDCFDAKNEGCLSHRRYPDQTRGRRIHEDHYVNPFYQDMALILQAESSRRLRGTTQVFVGTEDARLTDRLLHGLTVMSIAGPIARYLGLNDPLTDAIAIGHDNGHCPFGHYGEEWISDRSGHKLDHRVLSCIVLQKIDNHGHGLNLTWEVLNGIHCHSGMGKNGHGYQDLPDEFQLVYIADKIAYLFDDIEDAKRLGIDCSQIEAQFQPFGSTREERIENVIRELIKESTAVRPTPRLSFVGEFGTMFWQLQHFMYENFYEPMAERREYLGACLNLCWRYFTSEPYFAGIDPALILALLNDDEVFRLVDVLRNRHASPDELKQLKLCVTGMVGFLSNHPIDLEDPDLNWDPT